MQGIQLVYRNNQGLSIQITNNVAQYLFLEPREKLVVRYYFIKNGLEVSNTKLLNDVKEPTILDVKIRRPTSLPLSKLSDFKDIDSRPDNSIYFEMDFIAGDTSHLDVLYENLLEDRLKVKVFTIDTDSDSFENENTTTDGPDEFVKLVDVLIRPDGITFTYVYRRDGRLKKSPSKTSFEVLAGIVKPRILVEDHPDKSMGHSSILRGLAAEGYFVDYALDRIYKVVNDKKIEITLENLGIIIKDYCIVSEVLNILKSLDVELTQHTLIKAGERSLVSCDSICSLPSAKPQIVGDERELKSG